MWLVNVITALPLYSILPWAKHGLLLTILACFILRRSIFFFFFTAYFCYDFEIFLKTLGKKSHIITSVAIQYPSKTLLQGGERRNSHYISLFHGNLLQKFLSQKSVAIREVSSLKNFFI